MKTATDFTNISPTQRVARVLLGTAMIGAAMIAPVESFGYLALLPLLAILPITTAIIGFCPAYFATSRRGVVNPEAELSITAQIELGVIGTALIGILYVVPYETMGGFTVFALVGLAPLLIALMGTDPIVALQNRRAGVRYSPLAETDAVTAEVRSFAAKATPAAARDVTVRAA